MPTYKVQVILTVSVTVEAENPDRAAIRCEDLDIKVPSWFEDCMAADVDELRVMEPAVPSQ